MFSDLPLAETQQCLTAFTRDQYIGETTTITGGDILGDIVIMALEVEPNKFRFACGVSDFRKP